MLKTINPASLLMRIVVVLCGASPLAIVRADSIDFNRDVRPILSDRCYFCHGPDEATREAGLRLDIRAEAIDVLESGELLDRIHTADSDLQMPPPDSKLALSDDEKRVLAKWVEQGAHYSKHWAFELLPDSVSIPSVSDPEWCSDTIDKFVLSKLSEQGLHPSQAADPLRWLRRVTFDLTGLPPTADEIAAFEESLDGAPDQAFESVVDRLLNSQAYGEHMAIAWLDVARYADSYGYQSDKLNTQWPYRDWVVDAFNQNLPYDDFLTWQIAGDLLENPTREQRLATAFNRIHRLNNEGGAVFEEWRLENVADRVHTFGTAVLGLTMECCRCHDHKYDPIPTREYYALSAYFNSIDESGVYDRSEKVPCPSLLLPTAEQEVELQSARLAMKEAAERYAQVLEDARERWEAWEPTEGQSLSIPDLRLAIAFDDQDAFKDVYRPTQSDRAWTEMPDFVVVEECSVSRLAPDLAHDKQGGEAKVLPRKALPLDGERGVTVSGIEPFDRWLPMTVVVTLKETQRVSDRSVIAHHTRGTDCGYNGWDLSIENGYLESRMARVWPGNAISVRTVEAIPSGVWHQIAATYDGSSEAKGLRLFLNGEELETEVVRDSLKKSCNVKVDHGGEFVIGQRFRARGLAGGLIDDVRLFTRELSPVELQTLCGDAPKANNKPGLAYFVSAIDDPARAALQELTNARRTYVMAEEPIGEIPVMRELAQPRPAHVLTRGAYNAQTDDSTLVQRSVLSAIPLPVADGVSNDRLGLARWVTDDRHPLTARVAVNRIWGNFFSAPLVQTPENFGSQGDLPTHPRLLDWLSRDFVDSGWDVKRLCRRIALSATYRQDSKATEDKLARDPKNKWLSRGPAHRLSAEQIRDLALAASGLMNESIGGPPVSPYQPGGDLWKEANGMSPPYQQSVGTSLYRRSLYSVWKRTAPLPNMLAFDATTREVCTVARSRTNTPMQALVLLNDTQFIEASRVLAVELANGTDDPINGAMLRLAGRQPDTNEYTILNQLLTDERRYYAANVDAAKQLLALGESAIPKSTILTSLDSSELAALTNLCQIILNLDATIWKR